MDELDAALMDGFADAAGRLLSAGRDAEEVARVGRRVSSKVVSGSLRSWALVLRAGDGRIGAAGVAGDVVLTSCDVRAWCGPVAIPWPGVSLSAAARMFGVNRTTVSRWADLGELGEGVDGGDCLGGDAECPAELSSGTEAAWDVALHPRNGGVGVGGSARRAAEPASRGLGGKKQRKGMRVTWKQEVERQIAVAREQAVGDRFGPPSSYRVVGRRLMLDYTVNRANRKRDVVRVWTPYAYGVDPGGEVWSAQWGMLRRRLVERVPDGFEQALVRLERGLSGRARVWQWVCPRVDGGCGRLVYKLFLPMRVWTLGAAFSETEAARCRGGLGLGTEEAGEWDAGRLASPAKQGGFLCGRCCGLVYESSERSSSSGARADGSRRRVAVWDRFVKRISGGALRGRDVVVRRGDGGG